VGVVIPVRVCSTPDMPMHMRTTIDLSDALAREARALADEQQTTVRALVEEGLELVIAARRSRSAYRLPDLSFGEGGLVSGLEWSEIRELAYEGRG
jgi:hypothetical protein